MIRRLDESLGIPAELASGQSDADINAVAGQCPNRLSRGANCQFAPQARQLSARNQDTIHCRDWLGLREALADANSDLLQGDSAVVAGKPAKGINNYDDAWKDGLHVLGKL